MTDKTVCLNDFVNADNQNQYVKLRGLPFSATTQTIQEFFELADMQIAEDKIIIELKSGKKTGYALVFLSSGSEVTKAQQLLHKRAIGGRYIDV